MGSRKHLSVVLVLLMVAAAVAWGCRDHDVFGDRTLPANHGYLYTGDLDRSLLTIFAGVYAFSSGVSEGIHHSMVQVGGEFLNIGGAGRQ